MQQSLVMTLIGEDRPGLVDSVATIIAEHGGNWLESRMSRLGGKFAGIVHADVPEEAQRALADALTKLSREGMIVSVYPDRIVPGGKPQRQNLLEIVGQDRPGIVRQISHALAQMGVNVEELNTECGSAAMSGETLFRARARLSLPESCKVDDLRRALEKIAADLIVDVSLEDLPQAP